ncbi:tagatose-bisphosphate aldolase [Vagococcus sp. BWB3-3]|uniref:Tagatose 1,6-diphosphate aldolase n=1 Tax=Vagococcus allomyrinae TaxID=2794353 RepID=A0A940PEW8_9ENTE|nr:tagatose-bisphosphate aldolase [Vagococcus allomyrinae]
MKLSKNKRQAMEKLSTRDGIISALAIDQRGAMKKMMIKAGRKNVDEGEIERFKEIVSEELTDYGSAILLDPEYGLPAAKVRAKEAGLLLAYEKTGYDTALAGRLPDLLSDWSVKRIKEAGAEAVKFLLYYDVDEEPAINNKKHAFVERIGSECVAEDIPFYLELLSYDAVNSDNLSMAYAKVKPRKVIEMMKEFSRSRYYVDVLKVEVPVNMTFVGEKESDSAYTRAEALAYFKAQSDATDVPFIFLSAGVSAEMFQETLQFAKEAGSTFNGVLCGRATWAEGVIPFIQEGEEAARKWLQIVGRQNMEELNAVLAVTATSWKTKVD